MRFRPFAVANTIVSVIECARVADESLLIPEPQDVSKVSTDPFPPFIQQAT